MEKSCSVQGCGRPWIARGLCDMHYRRWRRHGDAAYVAPLIATEPKICAVDGCEDRAVARGWCKRHYDRWHSRGGDPAIRRRVVWKAFSHEPALGSYRGIHEWMNRWFPRTGRCEWCACTDRPTVYATARRGHYTLNRADWFEFCVRCHRRFDGTSDETRRLRRRLALGRSHDSVTGRFLPKPRD